MPVPPIVAHCGSTKFGNAFAHANYHDTLAGKVVLSIGCVTQPDSELFASYSPSEANAIKAYLDQLHLRKIDLATVVRVITPTGYIGQSTLHELCYAYNKGLPIEWQVDWPMYCPTCWVEGPESEHFFHSAMFVSELERLLVNHRAAPYLEGQLVRWGGHIVPVVRLESGQFALQVDIPCPICRACHGTQYLIEHEGLFDGSLLLPDGRVINYCDADERCAALCCADCAKIETTYYLLTVQIANQRVSTRRMPMFVLPDALPQHLARHVKNMITTPGFRQCEVTYGPATFTITLDRNDPQASTRPEVRVPLKDLAAWLYQPAVETVQTQQVQ